MESQIVVKIKKLDKKAVIPAYTRHGDAAKDIRAIETVTIWPKEVRMVKTGLSVEVPEGFVMNIFSRSGYAYKGIFLANSVGVIDSNYRGEICVLLYNSTDKLVVIEEHDRIAQIVINPVYNFDLVEVDNLEESNRGDNGFGSSGNR